MGVLHVVATPIGNLEDITLRALRVLREAKLIAAEDTRTTAKLLARHDIRTPMVSFFEHNELRRMEQVLDALEAGDVALVSEAGMPTISDPGYSLVQAAIAHGIQVVPIPGPSAVLAALAVSGLPTSSFLFIGFLPRRRAARKRSLGAVSGYSDTIVCFEAPHRLLAALADIEQVLGDRAIAVACELTKLYEGVWRGTVGEALQHFREERPRGEFTLVIAGAAEQRDHVWKEDRVRRVLGEILEAGASRRDAASTVARKAHWPRRDVYRIAAGYGRDQDEVAGDG